MSVSPEDRVRGPLRAARRQRWPGGVLHCPSLVPVAAAIAFWMPVAAATSDGARGSGQPATLASQRLALQALVLDEEASLVAGQSRLRMVHGSRSIPALDIYVTQPGTAIGDPAVRPIFTSIAFGATTDLLPLPPGIYDITVTVAGESESRMTIPGLGFDAGDVLTVIARDGASDGGHTDPGLVVIDTNTARSGGVF
jgi:hypothetical protein